MFLRFLEDQINTQQFPCDNTNTNIISFQSCALMCQSNKKTRFGEQSIQRFPAWTANSSLINKLWGRGGVTLAKPELPSGTFLFINLFLSNCGAFLCWLFFCVPQLELVMRVNLSFGCDHYIDCPRVTDKGNNSKSNALTCILYADTAWERGSSSIGESGKPLRECPHLPCPALVSWSHDELSQWWSLWR